MPLGKRAKITTTNTKAVKPFHWDNYRDTTMGRYLLAHEYAFMRRCLDTSAPSQRLLDMCCGSGRVAQPLHEARFNIIGVDIDPVALASFQERSRDIPLVQGDTLLLPFADCSFDCVTAIECCDYFDHCQILQEVNRILSLDGLLIFNVLNQYSYKWLLKRLKGRAHLRPFAYLSYRKWLQAAKVYGFAIEAIKGYGWPPFTRESNSALMGFAARLERTLRLEQLYPLSPKALIAARKRKEISVKKD